MAKKNKAASRPGKDFGNNPFSNLKGFTVSASPPEKPPQKLPPVERSKEENSGSFAEEMALLGVRPLPVDSKPDPENLRSPESQGAAVSEPESEEELFLQSIGEMQVCFSDQWSTDQDELPAASARRMKQLKQGKLIPDASLDLHGLQRAEVAAKIAFFLQNADYQGWQTLLVITGKGLHSEDNEPVLRKEVERYLAGAGRKWVAEWGRAPEKYGGAGALVLFLRKK